MEPAAIVNDMQKLETLRIVASVLRFNLYGSASRNQITRLQIVFGKFGLSRDERLSVVGRILGREIESFSDLASGEAMALLEEPYLADIVELLRGDRGRPEPHTDGEQEPDV